MLGTVTFYSVLLSSFIIINGLEDRQLDAILKLIDKQADNAKSSSEVISRGDETNDVKGKINIEDIIKLIKQANKNNEPVQQYTYSQKYKGKPNPLNKFHRKPQYESNRNSKETINRLWEQLLEQEPALKQSYQKRLPQNKLLNPKQYEIDNEVKKGSKGGLNKYTKIFVVLDPIALQKSRNTKDLPNLLSRILTETTSVVDRSDQDRSKVQRYKGFLIKDGFKTRRYRRESKEDGDSAEYRPKRSRNEHNSGGGSGRTAIPYVRQRGDIYEKDH